jgi:hypothetical protein
MGLLLTIIVSAFFLGMLNLRKNVLVIHASVMNFEGQSSSCSQEICDMFARFMERTYMRTNHGCHRIQGLIM